MTRVNVDRSLWSPMVVSCRSLVNDQTRIDDKIRAMRKTGIVALAALALLGVMFSICCFTYGISAAVSIVCGVGLGLGLLVLLAWWLARSLTYEKRYLHNQHEWHQQYMKYQGCIALLPKCRTLDEFLDNTEAAIRCLISFQKLVKDGVLCISKQKLMAIDAEKTRLYREAVAQQNQNALPVHTQTDVDVSWGHINNLLS